MKLFNGAVPPEIPELILFLEKTGKLDSMEEVAATLMDVISGNDADSAKTLFKTCQALCLSNLLIESIIEENRRLKRALACYAIKVENIQ
jgi:hypothetical protein